jgi:hypothetical protein
VVGNFLFLFLYFIGVCMFKKVLISIAATSMLISTFPAQAKFGSSRSSASSSTRTVQSSRAPVSKPAQTSIGGGSTASKQGGFSNGQSVGMTRSDVTQSVRNGGSTRQYQTNTGQYVGGPDYRYGQGQQQSGGMVYAPQPNVVNQGHSTGTLVGAAVGGALLGHMMTGNGSHGSTTVINNGGVAGNGGGVAYDNGAGPVTYGQQGYTGNSGGSGIGTFLMWVLVLSGLGALAFFVFRNFSGGAVSSSGGFASPVMRRKSEETELEDSKESMFLNFQKNNKPSGLSYIQSNCTEMMFSAIRDDVASGSDDHQVGVKSLECKVVDVTQEGSRLIGSVHYKGVLRETDGGETVETPVNEVWNFVHDGNRWMLAGIEQV